MDALNNPDDGTLSQLLSNPRLVVAVVGLSPSADRPSHRVARNLQGHGVRIVGVNPAMAAQGARLLGEPCYASVTQAAQALALEGLHIDVVDCFRRSEDIPPLAEEAVAIGARCLWMQQGVHHPEAAARARRAGLVVVQDRCIKIERARLLRTSANH